MCHICIKSQEFGANLGIILQKGQVFAHFFHQKTKIQGGYYPM